MIWKSICENRREIEECNDYIIELKKKLSVVEEFIIKINKNNSFKNYV